MVFVRAIAGTAKEKGKRMNKGYRGRLDCGRRMENERTGVRWDERNGRRSPSYERGEKEKTTHNICTRQIMDDANRLKCSKDQQKK